MESYLVFIFIRLKWLHVYLTKELPWKQEFKAKQNEEILCWVWRWTRTPGKQPHHHHAEDPERDTVRQQSSAWPCNSKEEIRTWPSMWNIGRQQQRLGRRKEAPPSRQDRRAVVSADCGQKQPDHLHLNPDSCQQLSRTSRKLPTSQAHGEHCLS